MAKKIRKLTPQQIARFPEFVDRWARIGLSTDPADRPRAERAIIDMYKAAGLDPPKKIIWCGSPFFMGLTRAITASVADNVRASVGDSVGDSVRASVWDSVEASVWDSVGASVWASVWASVRDSVEASVWDSVGASVRANVGASVAGDVWDSVRASVGDSVWDSVRGSVAASVADSVRDSVAGDVWANVGANVLDNVADIVMADVWDKVGASVRDSVKASVADNVRASVWDSVRASVWDSVRASVWDSVMASVADSVAASVRASVRDSVEASVWDSVGASVRDSVKDSVWASVYGQHEAGWLSFYSYFNEVVGLKMETDKINGLWELCQSSGWAIPHANICWVSERHNVLERNAQGRLHCPTGPAVMYPDGWAIYAINGVRVPEFVVMRPKDISVKIIEEESNAEIRRVMIDRFGGDGGGAGAYLAASGARIVDHDERYGTLRVKDVPDDEPIMMVEVVNRTPEHDGSWKHYWLRVNPECRPLFANGTVGDPQPLTAHAAIASTFGKYAHEYAPEFES